MFLATASIVGNLVIKRRKGTPQDKIATDTRNCVRFLIDEGHWCSSPSGSKDKDSGNAIVDKSLKMELLAVLGVEDMVAAEQMVTQLTPELSKLVGKIE